MVKWSNPLRLVQFITLQNLFCTNTCETKIKVKIQVLTVWLFKETKIILRVGNYNSTKKKSFI